MFYKEEPVETANSYFGHDVNVHPMGWFGLESDLSRVEVLNSTNPLMSVLGVRNSEGKVRVKSKTGLVKSLARRYGLTETDTKSFVNIFETEMDRRVISHRSKADVIRKCVDQIVFKR